MQTLKQEILSNPDSHPDIKCINDILYRKGRIFLSPSSSSKTSLLDEFHNSQQVDTRVSQKLIADWMPVLPREDKKGC